MIESDRFQVTIRYDSQDGAMPVVAAAGEVDIATIHQLRRAIVGVVGVAAGLDGNRQGVAVDLAGVTFIDAAGADLLVELTDRARRQGMALLLLHASQPVRHILTLAGLEEILAGPAEMRVDPADTLI